MMWNIFTGVSSVPTALEGAIKIANDPPCFYDRFGTCGQTGDLCKAIIKSKCRLRDCISTKFVK